MSTSIDLRPYQAPISAFLSDSVRRFACEHADVRASAMGVSCIAYGATLTLAFDTKEHSDAQVKEFQHHGPAWYGEDSEGRFCNSPLDFAFRVGEIVLDGFPDLDEVDSELFVTALDDTVERVHLEDDGDEGLNDVMFRCLLSIVERFRDYEVLDRETVFRVGVRMCDSTFEKFWTA